MRHSWEVWGPTSPHIVACGSSISPPPSCFTCLICGESNIYWVLRNNSSVHSVDVTLSCDTLVLITSSSSTSLTSSPFFFLPQERVSWTFFGCHYSSFLTRSLAFLELICNTPLSTFGLLSQGPASPWPSRENHLIWVDLSLMVPPGLV
jgi:hypothetical protein